MKRCHRKLIITLIISLFAGLTAGGASAEEQGDPFIGKRLYRSYCRLCHNSDGKGGGSLALKRKLKPADLTLPKYQKMTIIELADLIAGYQRSEKSPMPRWSVSLPQDNIRHISAYIGRITSTSLRYAGDVRRGKTIFAESCAACHGPKGKGDGVLARVIQAPMRDFTDPKSQRQLSDEGLINIITNGANGFMPAWKNDLSRDQITDVAAFVQSIRRSPTPQAR
jgi:cbb3-type cytochrome c oxidase subunit III